MTTTRARCRALVSRPDSLMPLPQPGARPRKLVGSDPSPQGGRPHTAPSAECTAAPRDRLAATLQAIRRMRTRLRSWFRLARCRVRFHCMPDIDTVSDDVAARREVAVRMADAARAWLDTLDEEQRAIGQGTIPVDDASDNERRRWFYTPTDHGGLTIHQQRPAQQRAAMRLVSTGLSPVRT